MPPKKKKTGQGTRTQPLADVATIKPTTATEEILATPAAVPDPKQAVAPTSTEKFQQNLGQIQTQQQQSLESDEKSALGVSGDFAIQGQPIQQSATEELLGGGATEERGTAALVAGTSLPGGGSEKDVFFQRQRAFLSESGLLPEGAPTFQEWSRENAVAMPAVEDGGASAQRIHAKQRERYEKEFGLAAGSADKQLEAQHKFGRENPLQGTGGSLSAGAPDGTQQAADPVPDGGDTRPFPGLNTVIRQGETLPDGSTPISIRLSDESGGGTLDVASLRQPPDNLTPEQKAKWEAQNETIVGFINEFEEQLNTALRGIPFDSMPGDIGPQIRQQITEQMKGALQQKISEAQRDQRNVGGFADIQEQAGGSTPAPDVREREEVSGLDELLSGPDEGGTGTTTPISKSDTTVNPKGEPLEKTDRRENETGVAPTKTDRRDNPDFVPEEKLGDAIREEAGGNVDPGTEGAPTTDDNITTTETDPVPDQATPEESAGNFQEFVDGLGDLAADSNLDFNDVESLGQNETVQNFIDNLLTTDPELSEEEKLAIRRSAEAGTQAALSQLSGRGLGRGSDAARAIIQGNIMAEFEIAREQGRVRSERVQQAIQAAGIEAGRESQRASNVFTFEGQEISRDVANQNFFNATRAQDLAEVKNAQGHSLEQRALDQKDRMLALDEDKFNEAVREFGAEFGLAIDAENFRQMLQSGQFDLSVIDQEQTNDLRNRSLIQEAVLTMRDQDIQENLGISKLELEAWSKGEDIKLDTVANMLQHLAIQNNYDISMAEIQIELAKLQGAAEGGKKKWYDVFLDLAPIGLALIPGVGPAAAAGTAAATRIPE